MPHIGSTSLFIYSESIPFTKIPTNHDDLVKLIMDFVRRIREDPKVRPQLHIPVEPDDLLVVRLKFNFFHDVITLTAFTPSFEALLRTHSDMFVYEYIATHKLSMLPNIQDAQKFKRRVEIFCKLAKLLDKFNLPISLIDDICFTYTGRCLQYLFPHKNSVEVEKVLCFLEQLIEDGLLEELHRRCQYYAKVAKAKIAKAHSQSK